MLIWQFFDENLGTFLMTNSSKIFIGIFQPLILLIFLEAIQMELNRRKGTQDITQ